MDVLRHEDAEVPRRLSVTYLLAAVAIFAGLAGAAAVFTIIEIWEERSRRKHKR